MLYSLKLSNLLNKTIEKSFCIFEPHENELHHYLIYAVNEQLNKKILFGRLLYEINNHDNVYKIIIGQKLYKVRSSDLKDRRLSIIDTIESNTNESTRVNSPETLFQVIDSFSKSNRKYHVTINDKKLQYVYLAIVILLALHECKRNISS